MAEAERDPGLRELSGLNNPGRGRPTTPEALSPQRYPMVKRPYRTQQDMIIRDEVDHAASSSSKMMMQSSSRSNQSSSIASRSKSADTRPRQGGGGGRPAPPSASRLPASTPAASASARPPQRTASSDNLNLLQHDVPSDQAHLHSVRDLVAMIEKNTKSQSANAYVRKWGCDLISPEPHTKTVTYRRERRRLEEGNGARREDEEEGAAKRNTTYNWTKDDEFQRKHQMGLEQFGQQFGQPSTQQQQQQQQQQDYADYGGGSNEFRMSSHLADLDSLLGKRKNDEDDLEVQWPPPSNASPMPPQEVQEYRQQDFHIPQEMQTAANGVEGGTYFENRRRQQLQQQQQGQQGSNVVEMDRQIKNIQNKFDTELDSLIDAYRDVQKSVQMTVASSSASASTTVGGGNVKGSLDCAPPADSESN